MQKKLSLKILLLCPVLYITGMGIANYYVAKKTTGVYGDEIYLKWMLPFLAALCVGTLIAWYLLRKKIPPIQREKRIPFLYLIFFIPLAAASVPSLVPKDGVNVSFIVPIALVILVGVPPCNTSIAKTRKTHQNAIAKYSRQFPLFSPELCVCMRPKDPCISR